MDLRLLKEQRKLAPHGDMRKFKNISMASENAYILIHLMSVFLTSTFTKLEVLFMYNLARSFCI